MNILSEATSMYAPVSGMGFTPLTSRATNTATARVYLALKSTRTLLTPIEYRIRTSDEFKDLPEADQNALNRMKTVLTNILNCQLKDLFKFADQAITDMRTILAQSGRLSPTVEKLANTILGSSFSLSRLESTLIFEAQTQYKEKNKQTEKLPSAASEDVNTENGEELVVCRICDEHVPASLFEQHTNTCIEAYQSEAHLNEVNQALLKICNSVANDFLNTDWPGERATMLDTTIPMLQLYFLLRKAYETDSHLMDSSDDLMSIHRSLLYLTKNTTNKPLIKKAIFSTVEKRRVSLVLTNAANILRMTRISGNDQVTKSVDNISVADFFFLKMVSAGAYARVFLGRKKKTGDLYAIKVLPKKEMRQKNQVKRVLAERDILMQFTNPFIVNFYYSIIAKNNLYLVMEYLPGGDLYSLLTNLGSLDEDTAKLYTLEIAQALQYLRMNGIIHRDLKPDNILVSTEGYLKLTDFGLSHLGAFDRQAQMISDPTLSVASSLVGTPDYTAPEIILNKSHTFSADYWSLGVMLYEFLMGEPPFHGEDETETHTNILRAIVDWEELREEGFSEEVIDFLQKLLITDPSKRLGANDINEILNHPWFAGVDPKTTEPPFVPALEAATDTEYFTQRYQFQTQDDSDILEDIAECSPEYRDELDADIEQFQAVSLKQLKEKNANLLENIRQRSHSISSFNMEEEDSEKEPSVLLYHHDGNDGSSSGRSDHDSVTGGNTPAMSMKVEPTLSFSPQAPLNNLRKAIEQTSSQFSLEQLLGAPPQSPQNSKKTTFDLPKTDPKNDVKKPESSSNLGGLGGLNGGMSLNVGLSGLNGGFGGFSGSSNTSSSGASGGSGGGFTLDALIGGMSMIPDQEFESDDSTVNENDQSLEALLSAGRSIAKNMSTSNKKKGDSNHVRKEKAELKTDSEDEDDTNNDSSKDGANWSLDALLKGIPR